MMRGRSLAVRLAALLAAVVVVVLLMAGVVVNRTVSQSLDATLSQRDQQRLGLAVAVAEEGIARGMNGRALHRLMQRVANETGGAVRIRDETGAIIVEAGRAPPGVETETLTTELSAAAGGGSLEVIIPNAQAPFLRTFNAALLLTGAIAVVALLAASAFVANRLTRPLHEVARAAQRLGAGDLSARAAGGPDAESAELAVAFNGMADRLERSEVLRRRAASDLAHDLATPATVLESQLQAMVDGVVPADAEQLERARASAAGLSGVILQLGELTQAESAPLQRRASRIALAETAREIAAALDGLARERGVEVAVDGPEVGVRADPGQLARAVRNVVTNAIQHSSSGGAVRIATADGPQVQLRVTDAGPGIAEEDLPFIFERFYRADRSRGGTPSGSGIGLTVARELIMANGGTIEVERTGASGTTFLIVLPRAD